MRATYLEVNYRRGKPMAAYLHLPHAPGAKSVRTERRTAELLVDFASDGTPLGVEIVAPASVTVADMNVVLESLGQATVDEEDLAPLAA